jgi:hypothetical protein
MNPCRYVEHPIQPNDDRHFRLDLLVLGRVIGKGVSLATTNHLGRHRTIENEDP